MGSCSTVKGFWLQLGQQVEVDEARAQTSRQPKLAPQPQFTPLSCPTTIWLHSSYVFPALLGFLTQHCRPKKIPVQHLSPIPHWVQAGKETDVAEAWG